MRIHLLFYSNDIFSSRVIQKKQHSQCRLYNVYSEHNYDITSYKLEPGNDVFKFSDEYFIRESSITTF